MIVARCSAKPLYILTSHETFSGGEALAYDLQEDAEQRRSRPSRPRPSIDGVAV
jgi:hypothetical protein